MNIAGAWLAWNRSAAYTITIELPSGKHEWHFALIARNHDHLTDNIVAASDLIREPHNFRELTAGWNATVQYDEGAAFFDANVAAIDVFQISQFSLDRRLAARRAWLARKAESSASIESVEKHRILHLNMNVR